MTTKKSFLFKTRIRKYVNERLYSDAHAYEVIEICTPRKVLIRRMNVTCIKPPTEFHAGGFSGHYSDNHGQKWSYESNDKFEVIAIRLGKKGWGLGRFHMSDKPHEFYDYNF